MNAQAIKDTFYATLQNRIAALNPARTVVIRGTTRPGVLVPENELPGTAVDGIAPAEAFCLRWTSLKIDRVSAGPLATLGCEVKYATDGSAGAGGMDRGRALSAMDDELSAALTEAPMRAAAVEYAEIAGGGMSNATAAGSHVFWSEPVFAPLDLRGERLERTATVEVFGYEQQSGQ